MFRSCSSIETNQVFPENSNNWPKKNISFFLQLANQFATKKKILSQQIKLRKYKN